MVAASDAHFLDARAAIKEVVTASHMVEVPKGIPNGGCFSKISEISYTSYTFGLFFASGKIQKMNKFAQNSKIFRQELKNRAI